MQPKNKDFLFRTLNCLLPALECFVQRVFSCRDARAVAPDPLMKQPSTSESARLILRNRPPEASSLVYHRLLLSRIVANSATHPFTTTALCMQPVPDLSPEAPAIIIAETTTFA